MEIMELVQSIMSQESIFTCLFIGLFLYQIKSHKVELDYYKELVNKVLKVIQEDVKEIKDDMTEMKGGKNNE